MPSQGISERQVFEAETVLSLRWIVATVLIFVALASIPLAAQSRDSVWTVRGGSYAGVVVAIDRAAATRQNSRFWRLSGTAAGGRIVGWNPSRLPAPVALRAGRGGSESDSAAFWEILRQMERDMGMQLFTPASLSLDVDPVDVIVVETKRMAGQEGITLITWSASGSPYDSRVYLNSNATMHNPQTVTHEMMHALGFGHTSGWSSVMNVGSAAKRLTVEDVAYAQVAFDSRTDSERLDMWERLALAAAREPRPAGLRDSNDSCTEFRAVRTSGIRVMLTDECEPMALPTVNPQRSMSCCR